LSRPEWELACRAPQIRTRIERTREGSLRGLQDFVDPALYVARPHQKERLDWLQKVCAPYQRQNKKIAEIGPNINISKLIGTTDAIDSDIQVLEYMLILLPDIKCWHSSVTILPFELNEFDVTVAAEVLEHVPYDDVRPAIRKLIHMSQHLIITLPNFGEIIPATSKRRDEFYNPDHHLWEPQPQNVLPLLTFVSDELKCKVRHQLASNDWFWFIEVDK